MSNPDPTVLAFIQAITRLMNACAAFVEFRTPVLGPPAP